VHDSFVRVDQFFGGARTPPIQQCDCRARSIRAVVCYEATDPSMNFHRALPANARPQTTATQERGFSSFLYFSYFTPWHFHGLTGSV